MGHREREREREEKQEGGRKGRGVGGKKERIW